MSNTAIYQSPMDDPVVTYMVNRQWTVDQKTKRKRYLSHLAHNSKYDQDIAGKIGGMLIYNQLIEQYLSDIIEMSIQFIRAEIWPETIALQIDTEKATFGKMIENFKQFATIEPNRELLLSLLTKYNLKRNQVVHDLFDVEDFDRLAEELNDYAELADEIIRLLQQYDDRICENFAQLENRVNFRKYLK